MDPGELVDALAGAWMERRRGAFREMCAVDLHWEDPFLREPLCGPGELGEHAARLWAAFPDLKVEPAGERLTGGRFVAAPLRIAGTHLGELEGIVPSGRLVAVHAVLYGELDPPGESLWRARVFLDAYDAGVQVGLLPRRGSLGERALLVLRGFGLRRPGPGEAGGGPPARR